MMQQDGFVTVSKYQEPTPSKTLQEVMASLQRPHDNSHRGETCWCKGGTVTEANEQEQS